MKIKKNIIWVIGIVLLVSLASAFVFFSSNPVKAVSSSSSTQLLSNEVQTAKIYVSGSSYIMTPSEFKVGQPVRLVADMSNFPGCSRSVVISAFGVRKTVTSSDNMIEFTPTKAGTFTIACSMNMYRGTFTVTESDGSKSNYIEQSKVSANSATCGGSGGCGCGGGKE
jgi:uncharacterized protein